MEQSFERTDLLRHSCLTTDNWPTMRELEDLETAWLAAGNGFAIVKDGVLICADGRPSMLRTAVNGIDRALTRGAVLASRYTLGHTNAIRLIDSAGITAISQPGGSHCDECISICADKHGISMLLSRDE